MRDLGAELKRLRLHGMAGAWADLVAIDLSHPSLADCSAEVLPEALVFGASDEVILATAVGGVVGFVGLVVPHLVRMAFGPDHRRRLEAVAEEFSVPVPCA